VLTALLTILAGHGPAWHSTLEDVVAQVTHAFATADAPRVPIQQPGRSPGVQVPDGFYGGTLKGITQHLDYIAGLGCTALWLSPIFENNAGAYHGYNINNYLDVDPHFGTKQDLIDLVETAHHRNPPLRIILDVVINHSGDNWAYPGGFPYYYSNDQQFPFGFWRRDDRPIPTELRQESLYYRRGEIHSPNGYDTYPELQHGDITVLKDYYGDDDAMGSELINILIATHCYWIREADVDGFRVDAVKHMGELACSRFCSNIREYAYALGKRDFFLFGEIASSNDELYDRYIGQNTSRQEGNQTVFFGLNSVLDFRLAGAVLTVLKGFRDPQPLFARLQAQRNRALNRGELGRYLVTFIDNHDSFWQPAGRFANGAPDAQVIAAIGYLLCSLGTACIYYGTEQGFAGQGGDNNMREAMFDTNTGQSLLNPDCTL
jgi:glycosidase